MSICFKHLALLFVLITGSSMLVYAQGPGDPGGGTDPDIPIDGGASLLLAAGAAYGAKKLADFRKKASQGQENGEN
jgi:hypothetical protein